MVPGGIANIVEIVVLASGANAFLAAHRGRVGPRFKAGEDILERHHARVDEHQRRIVVGHQRRARHPRVSVLLEIVEETAADVVHRCHTAADTVLAATRQGSSAMAAPSS